MRIGALILTLFFLVVQFRTTLVQLDYVLNKDFIIAELCVEREKEESTCDGKCHLKKELAKVDVDKRSDDQRTPLRLQFEELRYIDSPSFENLRSYFAIVAELPYDLNTQDTSSGFPTIYSPPPELS